MHRTFKNLLAPCFVLLLAAVALNLAAQSASAQLHLRDICRVKGQEENTLQGLGLVVGLNGTGDGDMIPTTRALASMMSLMGSPVPRGADGEEMLRELYDAENVALVIVTVTIPASGARQGDQLNCTVSALSAESLDGGNLMSTALLGPRPGTGRVYGFASGPVYLEDPTRAASGKVHGGCRLEEDFFNPYTLDGRVTLVLDQDHAGFQTAQEVATKVDEMIRFSLQTVSGDIPLARAIDQLNIEFELPPQYLEDPVSFIAQVLEQPIVTPPGEARVVINERAGTVVCGADVIIGPVAISHKGLVVQVGAEPAPYSTFAGIDPAGIGSTRLESLVLALDEMKVPPEDIIEIIKGIDRNGKLYGRLIIE